MWHSGTGHTHLENLMSTLEVPVITQRNLKKKERKVYTHVKALAEDSCKKVLQDDIKNAKYVEE